MACNCGEDPINNCGCGCPDCGCPEVPDTPPVFSCPDPEPCEEMVPDQCVYHVGGDIKCVDLPGEDDDAYSNYPGVKHYIVLEADTPLNKRLPKMLSNINDQLCYLFSKDHIARFLTLIDTDVTLKTQFCQMVCSCDCIDPPAPCAPISNLIREIDCVTGQVVWTWASTAPSGTTYEIKWHNEISGSGGTVVGTYHDVFTTDLTLTTTGLTNGLCTFFSIRTLCDDETASGWIDGLMACCPNVTTCGNVQNFTPNLNCAGFNIYFTWDLDLSADFYEVEWYRVVGGTPGSHTTTVIAGVQTRFDVYNVGPIDCVYARIRKKCLSGVYSAWTSYVFGCCG